MKQEKTPFRFYEDNVTLFYKQQEYDAFESVQKINFINQRFSVTDKLNAIGVSAGVFAKLHKEKMLLVNPNNGKHVNVSLKICEEIGENDFVTTLHVQEILQLVPDTAVFLCRYKSLEFQRIRVQKIEHIRESDLVISKMDYHNLEGNVKNGMQAMAAMPNIKEMTSEQVEQLRKDLIEYCALDTLAVVKIIKKLYEIL